MSRKRKKAKLDIGLKIKMRESKKTPGAWCYQVLNPDGSIDVEGAAIGSQAQILTQLHKYAERRGLGLITGFNNRLPTGRTVFLGESNNAD